ncbi:hypothetical protein [Verrucomicrobium sp. BvORR034]|uniref:hypothetical protein n=1 Tax=Verrucomicrobium sp. BvORR034 TaxID=1396418 RepID=UPI0006791573|nr:hypothetical protein [Verrucomicrobium sp. BvORR034]
MPTFHSSEFKARVAAWCPAQFRNEPFELQLTRAFLAASACAADQHRALLGARPIRPLKSYPDPVEALGFAKIDYTGWPDWVSGLEVKEMTAKVFKDLPEYSTSIPDSYRRPIAEGGRPWKRNLNAFGQFQPETEALWLYCEYRTHSDPTKLEIYTAQIKIV